MNPDLSDKARKDLILVEKAKNGDGKAFAALMDRYRDSIYYMLLKMVNNPVDAEDLTMEAFGKAFKSISSYTPMYAFSTWLFMIATNNCIDFIRKKQTKPSIIDHTDNSIDSLSVILHSELPDPEEALINEQKLDTLRRVIAQLKPPYREIIELRYYKEYTYEEIASKLDLPIGTVKVQLHRAKTLLYNIFNKKEKR